MKLQYFIIRFGLKKKTQLTVVKSLETYQDKL